MLQDNAHEAAALANAEEPLLGTSVEHISISETIATAVSWKQLGSILALGLPGGVMLAADAGAFEVTTALAGILGATPY